MAIETTPAGEGPVNTYPERHVAVLPASDLVPDLRAAMADHAGHLGGGGDAVLVGGPSVRADMGETVEGVRGPAELHLIVVEDA